MSKNRTVEIVTDMVQPIVGNYNFELVEVEYVKEGASWFLRVYIDKDGGITIDDCQVVSEKLSEKLDEIDPIKQQYYLEVSSPGLDRPLVKETDFVKYKGNEVEIKLYKALDKKKVFVGELIGLVDSKIVINQDGKVLEFSREQVSIVKRVIKF
jgi:ribosome maturation factor RimP